MPPIDYGSLLSAAVGAFFAAWAGAHLGFRRTKKERALDRRVEWHEEAIQSLALYEEQLNRLRKHALNALIVPLATTKPDLPTLIKVRADVWKELGECEGRVRAALRLADLYASDVAKVKCSVALQSVVNIVAGQWLDVSNEPEIPWADVQSKLMSTGDVRRSLFESLDVVLELSGAVAAVLGSGYRRRIELFRLKRLQKKLSSS
jgi:hypothetical protein